MNETVEYILKIQDQMSGSLKRIEENTGHLNTAVGKTHDTIGKLKGAFVEFFAVAKIFQFGQEAFTSYQKAAEGSAQLEATLKATGGAIGFNKKQLDEQAESLSKVSLNSADSITQMQSMLAIFPNLKGDNFKKAETAVMDLSAKMKIDLPSAVRMVGKAMQGDSRGLMALKNAGVMFTDSEQSKIESLVKTGHAKEAQAMLFKKMDETIAGSAAAAAKANPFQVMKNQIEPLMDKIGGAINKVIVAVMPIARMLLDVFSELVDDILPPILDIFKPIADILGFIINLVMLIVKPIIEALKPALVLIGELLKKFSHFLMEHQAIFQKIFQIIGKILGYIIHMVVTAFKFAFKIVEWIAHLGIVKTIFQGIGWVIDNFIVKPIKWIIEKVEWIWNKLKSAGHWLADKLGIKINDDATDKADATSTSPDAEVGDASKGLSGLSNSPDKVLGSGSQPKEAKLTNINIKIDTLSKFIFEPNTSAHDFVKKVQDVVTSTLLGAVNNSEIQAASGR